MKLTAEQRKAFLASPTQAVAARVINVDAKAFREGTRRGFGVFVSRGLGAWDDRTKAFRLATIEADTQEQRTAVCVAFRNGDDAPPSA